MDDLDHIRKTLSVHRSLLSGSSLVFTSDPRQGGEYQRSPPNSMTAANVEPFALVPAHPSNVSILTYENTLHDMVNWLRRFPTTNDQRLEDVRASLLKESYQGLDRIQSQKELEWNRQRAEIPYLSNAASGVISTGESYRDISLS